jgi:crossover junction endodeoxyribonuclease RuvC
MRVLGLDPGLRYTGWGLVEDIGSKRIAPAWGKIQPNPKLPLESRLAFLFEHLKDCFEIHKPDVVSLEKTLVGRGRYDSLKLAFARGVCLCVAGIFKVPVYEYPPTHIKKTITGYGAASKDQISFMVKEQLSIKDDISSDESDALAIAMSCITCLNTCNFFCFI